MPKVSVFDIVPWPTPAPTPVVVATIPNERIACRTEKVADLTANFGSDRRNAITRLWVLSGCKACGHCADMAAR